MNNDTNKHACCNRRHFLASNAYGIGGLALAWLLKQDDAFAEPKPPELEPRSFDLIRKQPDHEPTATAMISLFMQGGPSHLDLFDPKPGMKKYHLKPFPGKIKYDNAAQASSKVFHSPWKFRKHGDAGIEISELLPHLSNVVDDFTLVRSMHTGVNNHGQSINALNTGRTLKGRPVLGSWLTYGLGAETENLPTYVSLTDPAGLPVLGVDNWSNGWLPAIYQGTVIRPREPRILNLNAPPELAGGVQKRYLSFLQRLNKAHAQKHPGEFDLQARIASYELAAKMQSSATEALDITKETKATHRLYGLDDSVTKDYGTRCLIARRLIERGVRFAQVFTRYQFWDHHGNIRNSLPRSCRKVDRPSAALITDLKQRGLLDTTIVHWGGEMGRLPVIQNEKSIGRDHNTYGFSSLFAGGGFRGGYVHGATDDFGHHAVKDVVHHYDYHRTLLHLFGLNPEKLTFRRNNRDQSLLDGQPGKIVSALLNRPPKST